MKIVMEQFTKITKPNDGGLLQLLPPDLAEDIASSGAKVRAAIVNTMYSVERWAQCSLLDQ